MKGVAIFLTLVRIVSTQLQDISWLSKARLGGRWNLITSPKSQVHASGFSWLGRKVGSSEIVTLSSHAIRADSSTFFNEHTRVPDTEMNLRISLVALPRSNPPHV